jgi:SAM-dependent methyltransferase
MFEFHCNICGAFNRVEQLPSEPATCGCGSNMRSRALIYLLSIEIFGRNLALHEFPRLKSIRGLGISDQPCYALRLAERFHYTNTFYDAEPLFDATTEHPELAGLHDFVLAADVIEHIAPPIGRALQEVHRILKPHGFFGITVYCNPQGATEHFPDLHEYRIVPLGGSPVLINRRRDGVLEIREDLIFHGGSGATLEMREFSLSELKQNLLASGFHDVHFLTDNVPELGIYFDHDFSQPLIARKDPFIFDAAARAEFIDLWMANRDELCAARASRWLHLGRRLGLGPKLAWH